MSAGMKILLFFVLCCFTVCSGSRFGSATRDYLQRSDDVAVLRSLRAVTVDNRTNCGPGDTDPANRVNTTVRVNALIDELKARNFAAYIVTTGDAHQSEYPPEADRRRAYISGFDGSAGTAVVLASGERALWTDGRYFLQADDQLDCEWLLMKDGIDGYPDILEWLQENLKPGEKAAADAKLIAYGSWLSLSSGLEEEGKSIVPSAENLVDLVWGNDTENPQPPYSDSPAIIYPFEYAGQNLTEKLSEVRKALQEVNAAALVVTALDEVAWLYNIRGNDVPYNPVLRSYAIVTETWAKLYANGIQMSNITDQLTDVNISDYEDIWADLKDLSVDTSIGMIFLPGNARAPGCSFEVYNTVKETKRYLATTPTLLKKATKNRIEIEKMREAVINDGVALTRFLAYLEDQIISGKQWTELSAQNKLAEYRMEAGARELSFATISGYGEHGAIIHYESTNETDVAIGNSSLYLLDSGGQYFGATTDVTRTMHYGTPTADHIEMYTRVLMGNIDFGSLIFPYGTLKTRMDVLARRAIWSQGLDYRHGTSHGIGAYLNVHEPYLDEFQIGYVLSNEPGYYKDGEYGIRIEDQMTIVDANMKFDKDFYKLEMLTMVPYEPKLIDVNLLSDEQLEVLNTRFANIRATTGVKLQEGNYTSEYNWLLRKTENLTRIVVEQIETTDGAINTYACWLTLVLAGVVLRLH